MCPAKAAGLRKGGGPMQLDSILWLIAAGAFIAAEAATTALVSTWFAVGAVAALLVSFIPGVGLAWQFVVFAVVAAIVLAVMLPRLADRQRQFPAPVTNGSPLTIGKQGTVVRDIEPGELGRVHVGGLDWQARCDTPLPKGSKCKVTDVDGFILIVVPVESHEPAAV